MNLTRVAAAWLLRQLADSGHLERRDHPWPEHPDDWLATVSGNALAMASFLKPMSRARAERLLEGVLERAAAYNVDDDQPFVITGVAVFGFYPWLDVSELGDLDLAVKFAERRDGSASTDALLAHASASGRSFPHIVARLGWARTELLQLLCNRSCLHQRAHRGHHEGH